MELLKIIELDTTHLFLGLYGLLVILTVGLTIEVGCERLVKGIENRITTYRKAKAVHE